MKRFAMIRYMLLIITALGISAAYGQTAQITGTVQSNNGEALPFANISLQGTPIGLSTDEQGTFTFSDLSPGSYTVVASYLGYNRSIQTIEITEGQNVLMQFTLEENPNSFDEVVITGTLKEVNRLESPVPVEVYRPAFFKKNPTPNIYEALQNVNGVRPQLNCNVCNTGDIHINGLEGPYTMVLIDGMPIVSSLATVYGLSGIPNNMIERMEIVKGPASSLYGSEAIGGLINIITKKPDNASLLTVDLMGTSWQEFNTDLGLRINLNPSTSILTGVNYFNYNNPIDNNSDHFTDVTLQERVSVFQKWNFQRKHNRLFTLAARYYWEDRWGGEMNWTPTDRGGSEIYGEAITTERTEWLGQYQLPTKDNVLFSFSFNTHNQNSVYGDMPYIGNQRIGFGQITWDKTYRSHDLLLGSALRYTWYDDNTSATAIEATDFINNPEKTWLPGIFVLDEIKVAQKHTLLLGLRYDYNSNHGNIWTPRFAYKWQVTPTDIFRLNVGTGFRVVNLFTEDHAALTGARDVLIIEDLSPERSYNVNTNYIKKTYFDNGGSSSIELSAWYTHFTNAILPDYESDPNLIIYNNLDGSAVTQGISVNTDITLPSGFSLMLGGSLMDVSLIEDGVREQQILTERFMGTWALSQTFFGNNLVLDYTGNVYGPMRLPLLGDLDPRPEKSPWWSIQNIQVTYSGFDHIELYGGVKNLLNWTPWQNQDAPIIARSFDPFDREVEFGTDGSVIPTPNNPNALTFDPSYVYAPNQGIRGFLGIRYTIQ